MKFMFHFIISKKIWLFFACHSMFCTEAGTQYNISGLPAYAAFAVFWKKQFLFVKFPDKHYLGKCDTCTELKALKMKHLSQSQSDRVKKLLTEHNEAQQAERKAYATRFALVNFFYYLLSSGLLSSYRLFMHNNGCNANENVTSYFSCSKRTF